jgi:hypothetical protein
VVLDSIKENYLYGAFEAWKKWLDCCVCSKKTILKMGVKLSYTSISFLT